MATGIFFLFISSIQFMDFLFWIDLKNTMGINHITTILGPILNVCQPTILYLIKYIIFRPNIWSWKQGNLPIALANLAFFVYFVIQYMRYLSNERLVTSTKHGHLSWPWIKYFTPYPYLIMFALNIFYLFDIQYATLVFTITYLCLILSVKYFNYNIGELWCFFGSFIPLVFYIGTLPGGLLRG
jgi:hypothetical protein